jgi:hypothetical protein
MKLTNAQPSPKKWLCIQSVGVGQTETETPPAITSRCFCDDCKAKFVPLS